MSVGTLGPEGRWIGTLKGWVVIFHIDWRGEQVSMGTLGPEGEWMRSHIGESSKEKLKKKQYPLVVDLDFGPLHQIWHL